MTALRCAIASKVRGPCSDEAGVEVHNHNPLKYENTSLENHGAVRDELQTLLQNRQLFLNSALSLNTFKSTKISRKQIAAMHTGDFNPMYSFLSLIQLLVKGIKSRCDERLNKCAMEAPESDTRVKLNLFIY